MEDIIIVDTCILFDFMAGKKIHKKFESLLLESKVGISVITVYELFRGVESSKHIQQREELVNLCKVMELTRPVCRKAAEIFTSLKKKGSLIVNQDILIGATALYWKYPLLTSNKKDFEKIANIKLFE